MGKTIGLVANIFNEANALPGWLETHTPFFDDVRILHAGPRGEYSDDGTIEILEKWHIPYSCCSIDDGFGAVRTRALRLSPCDWVMLLDADERFYPIVKSLTCEGQSTPQNEADTILQSYDFRDLKTTIPNWENLKRLGADLTVMAHAPYDQGAMLREIIDDQPGLDAIITIRRHWHDFTMTKPTQNWNTDQDWQMRTVRNHESIYFDPNTRMHEQLRGVVNPERSRTSFGPFFDHQHFHFKHMEQEQRAHDVSTYDAIHEGRTPPTWEEFKNK